MKNTWRVLLLFFSIINLQSSCKQPIVPEPQPVLPDSLPPITTEGKNTFGCMVNDTLWIYSNNRGNLFADYYNGELVITSKKNINNVIGINIHKIFFGKNLFHLKKENDSTGKATYSYLNKIYLTDNTYTGQVKLLLLDSINKIVSGTFYFTAYDKNTGDSVSIKDGRFDIHY